VTIELFERTLLISPHADDETIACGGATGRAEIRLRDRRPPAPTV